MEPDFVYQNRTLFGIESSSVRLTWSVYYFFILLSSLLGDSTILIASIKYRAFKLPNFLVTIIHHMAACDVIISITSITPMIISLVANGWVTGRLMCILTAFTMYYTNMVSVLLVCAMTTSKLLILKFPLHPWFNEKRHAHLLCSTLWIVALNLPLTCISIDKSDAYFDYRIYTCYYAYSSDAWNKRIWLMHFLTIINYNIPIVTVVFTTILLLIAAQRIAQKKQVRLKRQGIRTAICTAGFCCIAFLPYTVFCIFVSSLYEELFYYRLAWSVLFLNVVGNFYIYSVTVTSFRKFLRARITILLRKLN